MRDQLYIASISENAPGLAAEYGIGLELDHYCTAENMEPPLFTETDRQVGRELAEAKKPAVMFHAPFNELHPAAIDPKIRDIAFQRYEQAYRLAWNRYGACKMVVHSGYLPYVYHKSWHHEKSVEFWKQYMEDKPQDFVICIENVMEDEPYMMAELAAELNHPNIRLCLDLGHANCMSSISTREWIKTMAPWMGHIHIHNNNGDQDSHRSLEDGTIDMADAIEGILQYCAADTTIAIESLDGRRALAWLKKEGFLK